MRQNLLLLLGCVVFAAITALIMLGEGRPPVKAPPLTPEQREARQEASVSLDELEAGGELVATGMDEARRRAESELESPFRVSGRVEGFREGLQARLVSRSQSIPDRPFGDTIALQYLERHEPIAVSADGTFEFLREFEAVDAQQDWWVEVGVHALQGSHSESFGVPGILVTGQSQPFVVEEGASEVDLSLQSLAPIELEVPVANWNAIGVPSVAVSLVLRESYEGWAAQIRDTIDVEGGSGRTRLRMSPFHAGMELRVVAQAAPAESDQTKISHGPWIQIEPGLTELEPLQPRPVGAIEVFLPSDRARLDHPDYEPARRDFRVSLRRMDPESSEFLSWPVEWSLPREDQLYDPSLGLMSGEEECTWNGDTVVGRMDWITPGAYELAAYDYVSRKHSGTVRIEVPAFGVVRTEVEWLGEVSTRIQIDPGPLHAGFDEYVLQTWIEEESGARRTAPGGIFAQSKRGLDLPPNAKRVGTVSVWNGEPIEGQAATSLHYYANEVRALESRKAGPADAPYPVLPLRKADHVHRVQLADDPGITQGSNMRLVGLDGQIDSAGLSFFIGQWRDLDLVGFPAGRYRLLRAPAERHINRDPYQLWAEFTIQPSSD